jgi:hypothetical protein
MKFLHFALVSLLTAFTARAQWKTTTYALKGGWNAIYLNGDAPQDTLENLLPAGVIEVWRWNTNPTQTQFAQSPLIPSAGTPEWSVWKRGLPLESSLSQLFGQSAYLVRCSGNATNSYSVSLKQSLRMPASSWVRNGANLLGFPSFKNGSTFPTFASYFATFPAAIASNAKVFKYVGGDLGAGNPLQVFSPNNERLDATQAYWFSAEVAGNFVAPLEISPSSANGISFGRSGSVVTVRIRNRTANAMTLTFTPEVSEAAPAGQAAVVGAVPLTRRTFNAVSLQWTETAFSSPFTEAIGPQGSLELNFGIYRAASAMSAAAADALFASFVRVTDSANLMDVRIPATARKSSLAGLWIGDVSLTNVSNKVSNAAQATATLAGGELVGLSVVGSGGFGYTDPPLVTIAPPHANGNLTASAVAALSGSGTLSSVSVTNPGNGYVNAPEISVSGPPPGVNASAIAVTGNDVDGTVATITPVITGTNYTTPPEVIIAPPEESVQAAAVAGVAGGQVTNIVVQRVGYFYPSVPNVTLSEPPASVTATASASVSSATGALSALTVLGGGSYYTSPPTVSFSSPTRITATATSVVSGGSVTSITPQLPGGYYPSSSLPTVTVAAPPSSVTALGTATRSGGSITQITINNPGGYYTTAPTVTFSGSGGATAVAQINAGVVTGVTITNPGQYTSTPTVTFSAPPTAVTATATAGGWSAGGINSYTIVNPGRGYFTAPTVTVAAPPVGSVPTATASVENGAVTQLAIVSPGSGYLTAPTLTLSAPPAPVRATVTAVVSSGRAWRYIINNPGAGYSEAPVLTIDAPPPPVQATASANLSAGGVVSYTITNPGKGYQFLQFAPAPLVSIAPPPAPTTALATALMTNGRVTAVNVTNPGTGYVAAPTISIAPPPANVRATATATVSSGAVTGFSIDSPGSGYDTAPVVSIEPPPPLAGTSTPKPFVLRTLLHLSDDNVVSLLPQVYLGQLAAAPHDVGLCTNESSLKQNALAGAQRFSSAHMPLDTVITAGSGSVGVGETLTRTIRIAYNDPTNPFVHAYHPDHDNKDARGAPLPAGVESPDITRECTFVFTASPPAGSSTTIGWGSSILGGTYTETITGLHKEPLVLSGIFELRRASEIGTLTR